MEIFGRNVNEVFNTFLGYFSHPDLIGEFVESEPLIRTQESRVGTTHEFVEPVMSHYLQPQERVLFNPARDANPFLHFFEALWMLAGRRDAKFMTDLVGRFKQFSDDGITMQGGYGYRWRTAFGFDQLNMLIQLLKTDKNSRRGVLQMWDPFRDSQTEAHLKSSDIPCNTSAYFKIRDGKLCMTVSCRSNDALLGAYGANVVHFSMLQEYIAAKVGVPMGRYTQMSDSLHVYTGGYGGEVWDRIMKSRTKGHSEGRVYRDGEVAALSMECECPHWNENLKKFFDIYDESGMTFLQPGDLDGEWFSGVVRPMWNAYVLHKRALRDSALQQTEYIKATDWRKACAEWLQRRNK